MQVARLLGKGVDRQLAQCRIVHDVHALKLDLVAAPGKPDEQEGPAEMLEVPLDKFDCLAACLDFLRLLAPRLFVLALFCSANSASDLRRASLLDLALTARQLKPPPDA